MGRSIIIYYHDYRDSYLYDIIFFNEMFKVVTQGVVNMACFIECMPYAIYFLFEY